MLNQTIGRLARYYDTATVVAALIDVVGCSSCVGSTSRCTSLHALIERHE